MKIKRGFVFFIFVLFMIGLAACTRSLSNSKQAKTNENPSEATTPVPTSDILSQLQLFVTQTAMAEQGMNVTQPAPAVPQDTPIAPIQPNVPAPSQEAPVATVLVMPTPAQVVIPTVQVPATYVLQNGEHPYCIARRFNVNPGELLSLSGLGGNSIVYAGMTLRIPQGGSRFPSERALRPHPVTYTVSSGETIYSIACQFGDVDPLAIAANNNLQQPYSLTSGQTLHIP